MIEWFVNTAGINHDLSSRLDSASWLWARPTVLWVGLAIVAILAFWIVRRHAKNLPQLPPIARGLLGACRVIVLLLLVVVLAGPYLRVEEELTRKPVLAVIIDESLSMTFPAGPFDADTNKALAPLVIKQSDGEEQPTIPDTTSRLALLEQFLAQQDETLIKPLEERYDVRVYRTARTVRNTPLVEETDEAMAQDKLNESDLGTALQQAIDDTAGRPVGGILLFSDGRWTTGPDPQPIAARMISSSSDDAEQSRAAVWTIPVGSSTGQPDVSVVDVLSPGRVAHEDTASIVVTIASQQLDGNTANVKLLDENDQVVDEQPLTLQQDERQQIQLSYEGKQMGSHALTVVVEKLPAEKIEVNNRLQTIINVDDQKLRVLYVDGYPRWDFRFLDHAMKRDKGIEPIIVTEAQFAAEAESPAQLPALAGMPQDVAGFAEFDVIILGDISPAILPTQLQEQLVQAVQDEGVGLIVQAGPLQMPDQFIGSPLGELLPLEFTDQKPGGINAPTFAPFAIKVTAEGANHPALQLYHEADRNRRVFSRMPSFFWSGPEGTTRPATTVLVNAELRVGQRRNEFPLIASHYAGRGKCVYIGTDATYRWRHAIGSHLFYRFWGQAIRHAAGSEQQRSGDSWMEVYPQQVKPEQLVAIELYCVDSDGNPLDVPEVHLRLSGEDQLDDFSLLNSGEPGRFRGSWTPQQAGDFTISYTDGRGKRVAGSVHVSSSTQELRHVTVDRDTLRLIAEASEGGMLELQELDQLPDLLVGEPTVQQMTYEDDAWDNWIVLVLLVSVYCVDVGIRRVMGLT